MAPYLCTIYFTISLCMHVFLESICLSFHQRACVLSCGPPSMVASVRAAAAAVEFDLHEETFLL